MELDVANFAVFHQDYEQSVVHKTCLVAHDVRMY